MNAESTFTSTKGGSLPTITPELLWFESFTTGAPECAVMLPNGDKAFAHRGAVHAMPEAPRPVFFHLATTNPPRPLFLPCLPLPML